MIRIGLVGNPSQVQQVNDLLRNASLFMPTGIYWDDKSKYSTQNQIDHPVLIFKDDDELISSSDAIVFVSFCNADFPTVVKALKASRHIFIDPSDILLPEMLSEIHKLGEEAGVLYYIKHKPLNEDFQASLENFSIRPEFLDIYRYVPAGKETRLKEIQKIIRQELLFIFSLNNHEIKKYHLKTVPYCSLNPYIINVRFEFSNSSAANLTINFFTTNNSRFTELYFNENILRIDSSNNEIELIDRQSGTLKVGRNSHNLKNESKSTAELDNFLILLDNDSFPAGYKESGLSAHQLVWRIVKQISDVKVSLY